MDNYRPIALASVISKIFESLLIDMCGDTLRSGDNQFAFKSEHSTDTCIFVFKQVVNYYNRNGSPVFACFLDASKAFDRVNHWSLYRQLLMRGTNIFVVRILKSWYETQRFFVRWDKSMSNSFKVTNGVRQGGVMSPLLYNVYIDKLNDMLNKCNYGCELNNIKFNNLSYADDMVLLAPSVDALQKMINICETFAHDFDVLYNSKKSTCMCFCPKIRKLNGNYKTVLCSKELAYTDSTTYLGYVICSDSRDELDIKRQYRSICIRGNSLCRKFNKCSKEIKITLFRSYCLSMYCTALWCDFNVKTIKSLQVCYNNAFRMILQRPRSCSASAMFVENNVPSFYEYIRTSVFNFKCRIERSKNVLISCAKTKMLRDSKLYNKWMQFLYA